MSKEISVRKDIEQSLPGTSFPGTLWWKPVFDWQREANAALRASSPAFLPRSFWDSETRMFDTMQQSMNRMFGQLFNNRQMLTPWWLGTRPEPYVDIVENDEGFIIKADVPGVYEEDLDVAVTDSALVITGEREESREEEEGKFIRRECHTGSFSRVIALPEEADPNSVSATFDRNILTVKVSRKRVQDGKEHVPEPSRNRQKSKASSSQKG